MKEEYRAYHNDFFKENHRYCIICNDDDETDEIKENYERNTIQNQLLQDQIFSDDYDEITKELDAAALIQSNLLEDQDLSSDEE